MLKDVFDLSLEESADVLETSIGAVKAALHRGRERLRGVEEAPAVRRPVPSHALVERFATLFNAGDQAGLLALVQDNAAAENVGCSYQFGADMHRGTKSWFHGALSQHPEWPNWIRWEQQRAEVAVYEGEPLLLMLHTRSGEEAVEAIVRLEEEDGKVARLRSYGFCPQVVTAIGETLGRKVVTGIYRYPTVEPGVAFGN